jgi:hypothetical protein
MEHNLNEIKRQLNEYQISNEKYKQEIEDLKNKNTKLTKNLNNLNEKLDQYVIDLERSKIQCDLYKLNQDYARQKSQLYKNEIEQLKKMIEQSICLKEYELMTIEIKELRCDIDKINRENGKLKLEKEKLEKTPFNVDSLLEYIDTNNNEQLKRLKNEIETINFSKSQIECSIKSFIDNFIQFGKETSDKLHIFPSYFTQIPQISIEESLEISQKGLEILKRQIFDILSKRNSILDSRTKENPSKYPKNPLNLTETTQNIINCSSNIKIEKTSQISRNMSLSSESNLAIPQLNQSTEKQEYKTLKSLLNSVPMILPHHDTIENIEATHELAQKRPRVEANITKVVRTSPYKKCHLCGFKAKKVGYLAMHMRRHN